MLSFRTRTSTGGLDVLHVPFTYFPDPVGGTEVYVAALAKALCGAGLTTAVAAPGDRNDEYVHDDVHVFRFAGVKKADLLEAYGAPDELAALAFSAILTRVRPRIVNLHARSSVVSERLVDAAHSAGARVIFTYHTPTVTCARGTMMRFGTATCDGKMDARQCTECVLQKHGVSKPTRNILSRFPTSIGRALGQKKAFGWFVHRDANVGFGH